MAESSLKTWLFSMQLDFGNSLQRKRDEFHSINQTVADFCCGRFREVKSRLRTTHGLVRSYNLCCLNWCTGLFSTPICTVSMPEKSHSGTRL